ncbi:hypothetical protein LT85_2057 [Collimonas arenae]|uniref:Uncharacterized protein n=1 Tax=Collimonas arenae TaxID=279058 RepID=A0A0A1FBU1_9BURK|nr:hypothetical protein LT85_2057 [Collimonas arenae]
MHKKTGLKPNAVQLRVNGIFIYGKLPASMKHLRERLVTS